MSLTKAKLYDSFGCMIESESQTPASLSELDPKEIERLLAEQGAVLLRGFDLDLTKFVDFTSLFAKEAVRHVVPSIRPPVSADGTVTEVLVGNHDVDLHGEMYYLPRRPKLLWLYCITPSAIGGATTLCNAEEILEQLKPETRNLFAQTELLYHSHLPKSNWTAFSPLGTIEDVLERLSVSPGVRNIKFDRATEVLDYDFVTPAVIKSPSGRDVFTNSILNIKQYEHLNLLSVQLADGAAIPAHIIADIKSTGERLTKKVAWKTGDLIVVENSGIMHGRAAFDGPRKILTRFTMAA